MEHIGEITFAAVLALAIVAACILLHLSGGGMSGMVPA